VDVSAHPGSPHPSEHADRPQEACASRVKASGSNAFMHVTVTSEPGKGSALTVRLPGRADS